MIKLKKLRDTIYYMEHERDTDRPQLVYLKGEKFSVMIDTGNSRRHLEQFLQAVEEAGLPMPELALITHWHWDHTFAMHAFPGKTVACTETNGHLKRMKDWKWEDEAMKARLEFGEEIEFADSHIRKEYGCLSDIRVAEADILFEEYLKIDLGGISCEMRKVGGPHEADSCVILVPEEKVLVSGDAHSGDYYHMQGAVDPEKMADYIGRLRSMDFDVYMMGHGEPVSKQEILKELEALC